MFGWLQTTGVILGALVIVLGVAIAMEWVPLPGRPARDDTVVAGGGQNTTIVTERRSDPDVVTEGRTDLLRSSPRRGPTLSHAEAFG